MIDLWFEAVTRPMANALMILETAFGGETALALVTAAIMARAVNMAPAAGQLRTIRKIGALRGQMSLIEQGRGSPIDKSQRTAALFRQHGVKGPGCAGMMVLTVGVVAGLMHAAVVISAGPAPEVAYGWLTRPADAPRDLAGAALGQRGWSSAVLAIITATCTMIQQRLQGTPTNLDGRQKAIRRAAQGIIPAAAGALCVLFPLGPALVLTTYTAATAATTSLVMRIAGQPENDR